jgi:hypothetical protein
MKRKLHVVAGGIMLCVSICYGQVDPTASKMADAFLTGVKLIDGYPFPLGKEVGGKNSGVAQRCAYSALLCGLSPIPCGFMRACSGGDWHFRLKSRGGALKGAHLLATCSCSPCLLVSQKQPVVNFFAL